MRVFVTGGNGFIGSVVVRRLVERGATVRCLLRRTSDASRIAGLKFERVEGDVRDAQPWGEALRGCDAAIHLAAIANWSNIHSPEIDDVIVGGTRNVLEAARVAGCNRLVHVSSSLAVCGSTKPRVFNEASPNRLPSDKLVYARAKMMAEDLCRKAASQGLHVVIVNPCEVYGPHDDTLVTARNLIDFAKHAPVLVCAGGTAVVYVEDVAAGILAAMDRGRAGERYILGGENLTVRQIAELTLELLGQKKSIVQLPNWMISAVAWCGRTFHIPLPFDPEVVPYATRYWLMDSSKARHELGIDFRSARDTLRPTLQWLQESGHVQ
jgi:dihydroflavonol-4-reductase